MKTKISHLGRSTVSVILAVMMLLSTMLIGTVSNVEALTSTDTVYFADNYGSWSSVNAYIWKDKEGNLGDWPGIKMTDTGSVTSDGKKIFSCYNENLSSKNQIIFNYNGGQTNNLTLNRGKLFRRTSEKNGDWKNIYQFSVASVLPSGCTSATLKNGSLAYEGDTVTVTVKVSSGYSCTGLQGVADASVTKSDDNTYSITFKATKDLENITPIVGEAKNLNLKVAVVKYADVDSTDKNRLSDLNVTYTSSNGSQSTTKMTRDADGAKVYFKASNAWSKVVEFYLYDLVLPEGTTKFKLNKGGEVTISDEVDYYAIYHYGSFKNESFTESDRYYTATVTADTSVATGATASFTASPAGLKFNDDDSVLMYKCNAALALSKSFDTEKYNFTKWSDGTTDFTEDSYTVKGDTALTAYFEKKGSYKVTVESDNGGAAEADVTTAYNGQKVTVTVNADDNHVFDGISVKEKTSQDAVDCTKNENGTYTFVMPDDDVNVHAKFREKNTYTVTVVSANQQLGTVSIADTNETTAQVKEGDKVTFTAKPKEGYALSGWTVNGTSETCTDLTLSLEITADTTVVANFEKVTVTPSGYYLLCGENAKFEANSYTPVPLYKNEKDEYYADFNAADITKNKDYYIIFSTKKDTSGIIVESNSNNVKVESVSGNGFSLYDQGGDVNVVGQGTNNVRFAKVYINGDSDVTGFTINITNLDLGNKTITYSAKPTFDVAPANTVEITAKDGTIRGTTATIADLGNTTIEVTTPEGKTLKATDSFSNKAQTVKKVPDKSTVKVTTTIDESKTFAGVSGSGYYVKGFSINGIFGGVLSQSEGKSHDSDVYTFEFTVNQELYNETKLEITPVYFLKDDSNCVYFYIENYDSAKQIWGNTPSCYVYYGSGTTTLEALGYYPGQPMVDYNGSIFTQIPKYIVSDGNQVNITGMTLNNYVWDDVHSAYNGKNQREDNAQTYDYDDFVKIADSGVNANNIIYRFKYNTHDNVPKDTLVTSDTDADGWEVFLNYQNYPTDIFGNELGNEKLDYKDTQSVTSKDNCLSIISDGYQNNYIGKYATAWSIYNNKTGEKVATIPSSALLYALDKTDAQITDAINLGTTPGDFLPGKEDRDKHWTTFKTLYKNYKGFYARINFEGAISDGADYGNRLDGRWYYTKSEQEITGEIKIQYANTLNDYNVGDFYEDKFANDEPTSIIGTTTGASAYFTNTKDHVRKLNTTADNTQDYKFEVTATSTAAYTFVGWYRLIDGDYKAINPSNMNSLTGAVTRNSDVTLVARYIKTPGGSMTFQHSLYKGENAGGGKATTEIQVVVKNSKDESLYDSGKIAGTASIDKTKITELARQEGLTVTVTLYTTTKNLYNFNGYYSAENTTVTKSFTPDSTPVVSGDRKEGLVTTSVHSFSFNEYYHEHEDTLIGDNAGTVYYNFYSDITSIKVPYKVQFSYTDRMGDPKYYNKAGYVDPENTSSYTFVEKNTETNGEGSKAVEVTLTDSFILSLAPYESNFTKNLTWNKTPVSNTAFDSSDSKSIASAVVNSTQSDRTIHLNVFRDKTTKKPTSHDNVDGAFELFTKNDSAELPYGSVFYTSNGDGTYTYDITAPKTYKDKQFMYWAIYSDPDCKNLVINAYNSEGHFSYVAYDNCWIVPVYGESSTPVASVKDVYTSTQFMEVTRNQWTADTNSNFAGFDADSMNTLDTNEDFIKVKGEDKLYADFVLNFFYNGKQLSVFDPNSNNVKAGVLIQRLELDENETGTGYITDLNHYANKYSKAELEQAKNDAINKINNKPSTIKSVKQQIDNSRLDNKNRLQYYTLFNNVKGNNNCVFRLYTYIQYTDANGETAVKLSDPVYFTFCDIANKS